MSLDLAAIAVAVQTCPLVAGLHSGPHGTIVTTTARGQLVGLATHDEDWLAVGVVGRDPATADEIADQVRAAISDYAPHLRVTVTVADRYTGEPGQ